MTDERRVEVAAEALRADGWTCEYHEPTARRGECSGCDATLDASARAVVAALDALEAREYARRTGIPRLVAALRDAQAEVEAAREAHARAEKAEAQVAAVLAECRKVATVSGNASGYPYVLVNTIVGAIERAS